MTPAQRKTWVRVLTLVVIITGRPAIAMACPACADAMLLYRFPFLDLLLAVFIIWGLLAIAINLSVGRDSPSALRGDPSVWRLALWGIVVYVLFSIPVIPHFGDGLLMLGWGLFLIKRSFYPPEPGQPGSAAIRKGKLLHQGALLLIAVLIVSSYIRERTLERRIYWMGVAPPHMANIERTFAAPIIAHQQGAVAPLVNDVRQHLRPPHFPRYRLSRDFYCLAKIGGEEAEEAEEVLRDSIDVLNQAPEPDFRVLAAACFAYADVARERALPLLVKLHTEGTESGSAERKVIALTAAARTATEAGVLFTLDHLAATLLSEWEQAGAWDIDRQLQMMLFALSERKSAVELAAVPLYNNSAVGMSQNRSFVERFEASTIRSGQISREQLAEMRAYWERELGSP
ncbi:hypothetical protein [Planctomicrobium sp. SH664]|uniref:hypothetical protein n=1 Tax=Planctomicrobium sp. SH664 TaxID=3448125 RepID=UPI003F5BC67E